MFLWFNLKNKKAMKAKNLISIVKRATCCIAVILLSGSNFTAKSESSKRFECVDNRDLRAYLEERDYVVYSITEAQPGSCDRIVDTQSTTTHLLVHIESNSIVGMEDIPAN